MANRAEELLASYKKLLELFNKQLFIANQARYDDQIDQIVALEKEKLSYQSAIEQVRQNEAEYEEIVASCRNELMQYLERLQNLNEQLQQIISAWYSNDSQTMKQVSVHRKTLQSYGGVNRNDGISYYFDEKK